MSGVAVARRFGAPRVAGVLAAVDRVVRTRAEALPDGAGEERRDREQVERDVERVPNAMHVQEESRCCRTRSGNTDRVTTVPRRYSAPATTDSIRPARPTGSPVGSIAIDTWPPTMGRMNWKKLP